ncbi:thiamine pyrophosphate-requiring protein [Natrinema salifodinae]|uniref:Acetolactate synthase-1/2/3 large subunit n=1 Tax=Natrinema salifodinae TaxID=1202768 RepID=A0A1I0LX84_9EURY|nr:thiamine pyrophosphate-requiring protein [Natrinema salifodinae]SEV80102.1 acetolactate synthase-1/2/3 large subunit [Natrinema salifodinae]
MRKQADSESSEESADGIVAGERLLRSLAERGVSYIFGNLGTDHTPLLEAMVRVERDGEGDEIPELIACPHEFVAMSVAHGYAVATGRPQAVLVHVDVGTQNLGAAMHNAHRANAPVFIISGLAPVTESGHAGSRDHSIHFAQDVFDQPAIVEEYCRWEAEYRPPADPDRLVTRGLERAQTAPEGPVYLTATREALETEIELAPSRTNLDTVTQRMGADAETVETLAERIKEATAPLVITSRIGSPASAQGLETLVEFAETAGAGVVEHAPTHLCFPRDHDLHAGYEPTAVFDETDLVLVADTDVPWVPSRGAPDVPVIQLDVDPSKRLYPQWDFPITETVRADATATLRDVTERLDPSAGDEGRERWQRVVAARREERQSELEEQRASDRLTPAVLSDALNRVVDESTVVIEDTVTSRDAVLDYLELTEPRSYYQKGGAGLGWTGGAAVGTALGRPDDRIVSLVGDGSYFFSVPTAWNWLSAVADAPSLTVIYNNSGWNAVKTSTLAEHPDGAAADDGVPGSVFDEPADLTAPANVVDAHTETVTDPDRLVEALEAGAAAVDDGTHAVIDVRLEPIS